MEMKKGGFKKKLDFSSNFMKHRRNIHRGVLIKFKMKLPWKPRYQNNGVG